QGAQEAKASVFRALWTKLVLMLLSFLVAVVVVFNVHQINRSLRQAASLSKWRASRPESLPLTRRTVLAGHGIDVFAGGRGLLERRRLRRRSLHQRLEQPH